jgi:ribosomal protein S27AE
LSPNPDPVKPERPRYEVADIFRKHIGEYKRTHRLSYEQSRAVSAIMDCRTPALGGVLKVCTACKHWEFHYKSCKNRHCPKCGAFEKAQWLEAQKLWLLPIHYYHVVFTIDHVFNPLVWHNQDLLYNLLIEIAAQLLKEFGQKYLGGEIGFSMVLHTWGQTMQEHPHCHFIVTGGALVSSPIGYRWQAASHKFLFPVKLLSKEFRRSFCAAVRQLGLDGKLETNDNRLDVAQIVSEAQSKDWEVFIQSPLYGVEKLLDYLGRYIFRIAISNHRIVSVSRDSITFEYYDNRDGGKQKRMTLSAMEFIRRFLAHVLPARFVRIRHFGLHHGSCRKKLQHARRLLGLPFQLPVILKLKFLDWFQKISQSDQDPRTCPSCGAGIMLPVREFGPVFGWRLKLHAALGLLSSWKNAFA